MKLKHYFKTIAAVVILMITVASAKAECAYTIFENDTLTFYYGTPTTAQMNSSKCHLFNITWEYSFSQESYANDIVTVIFDKSMFGQTPSRNSLNFWFRELNNLEEVLNIALLGTSSDIKVLDYMFYNCKKLRKVPFTCYYNNYQCFFSTVNVESMYSMFEGCESLRCLDLSDFNTQKVTRMVNMFSGCKSLETILVGSSWSVSGITEDNFGREMFSQCFNLVGAISYDKDKTSYKYANTSNGYLKNASTNEISSIPYAYYKKGVLRFYYDQYYGSSTCYKLNVSTPGYLADHKDDITKVIFDYSFSKYKPTSCNSWFMECSKLTTIDRLYNLDLSKVSDYSYMFYGCSALTTIDLSASESATASGTDFSYMFAKCTKLSNLKLMKRYYKNNQPCTMAHMFDGCSSLSSMVFLTDFYTNNAYDMQFMFSGCSSIKDFSKNSTVATYLSTFSCKNFSYMFFGCSAVTDLSITSTLNTENAENMEGMFMGCGQITELRLEKFNTSNVTSIKAMFAKCTNLKTIYVSDNWSTQKVTDDKMSFANSTNLVGGKGTTFSSASGSYARIDQGASDPGYLTPYSSKITYHLDGGSVSGNPSTYTVEDKTFKLQNPSRSGYIFNGWSGTDIDGLSPDVTVTSGSSYPREYTAHWTCDLTSTSNTVKLVPSAEYYDNTPITLTVTVNGTTLRENIDFTTSNPIPVVNESGTYTVKITGIGDYTGTKSVSITIDALIDVTVTPDALSKTYGDDDPTEFTYTTVGLKSGDKLEGSLSRQSGEDAGQYLITGTLTNKKYRVTIDEVMFTINAKTVISPTILLESEVYVYNDEAIEPRVSVFDGTTLIPSNEYTVVYQNNRAIGTGNIVIVDKTGGNYTVSSSTDFQIVDKASAIEVTLITSEGNQTIYAVSGQKLTRPIREGYTAYLYTDADKTIEWDYDTDVITAPVTLYLELEPNLHYIDFNIDGAYPLPIMSIYYGEEITLPTLGKTGYTFTWLDTPPATMPDKDLEIRGTYTINKHNLVYLLDGQEYSSEQVEYNTPLTLKANPAARTGYKFSGWSSLPATMPDKDVTISGSYIPNKHTITFNIDGESIVVETAYNASIASLLPKKPGFKFVPSTTIEATMPDIDLIVSGKWEIRTYTLSFYADGKECQTVTLHYGDKIEPIAAPVKEGYVFMGWNDLPATMPDNDMMVFGSFKKDDNVTPVSEIADNSSETRVWAYNHTIYIETAPDSQYKIIDLQGRIITTSTTKSSHDEINLSRSGIFIIVTNGNSFKVSVR